MSIQIIVGDLVLMPNVIFHCQNKQDLVYVSAVYMSKVASMPALCGVCSDG